MAAKTIETRAVISAQDKTGATFAQVAQKLRGIGETASSVNRRIDGVARGMSAVGRQAQMHASIAQRMSAGWSAPVVAAAAGSKMAAINQKMAGIRSGLSDFAAAAAPGTAGMMLGMGGAAVGGLALGGAATYGLRKAISFDEAMAEVRKKVDLPAGESWRTVERLIDSNARKYGIAREEMAALTAQAGQAGVAFKDLAGFMELTAKASAAWDMPAREASERLAKIQAQTQWTIPQLKEWADQVNELGDKSAAAERDIVEMFGRSAAAAKAAGVPFATTQAILTSLSGVGMQPEVASRFLNSLTGTLATASAPKKGLDPYKALGLRASAVASGMKTDATNTIVQLLERLEKNKNRVAISQLLFGKEWYDEALRSGQALPEVIKNLKLIKSGSWHGSLDRNMVTTLSTTTSHLERFGAMTSQIGDRLARWALPSINAQLEKMLQSFDKAEKSGFLTRPDGAPISKLAEKTPVPFGEKNRALFLSGARETISPPSSLWSRFVDNSRPQINMKFGSELGESAVPKGAMTGFGVVPQGYDKFGFGAGGLSERWKNFDDLIYRALARPGQHVEAKAKLEGSAEVTNRVIVEPSPDFLVRVEQRVNARGALRSDVGVTMRQD